MKLYEQPWPVTDGEFRFAQMGFIVDDVIEASRKWAAVHGVGPFHLLPVVDQTLTRGDETVTVRVQAGVAQAGPVQIELVQQHDDQPSIYRNWNGFHQICTVTSDFDAKVEHYRSLGYDAWLNESPRFRVAYVDTVRDFGCFIEIVQHSPWFLDQLAQIAQACATWDGVTDPVRLMTRDGYQAL